LVASLPLAGCADVESALFGDEGAAPEAVAAAPASPDSATTLPQQGFAGGTLPGTLPGDTTVSTSASGGPVFASSALNISPVTISSGADTGTGVNKSIQALRSQVVNLQTRLMSSAQRLSDLRTSDVGSANAYYQAKANITARLQIGTTKGNPELVAQWNVAQASLDVLTGNINSLNALGTEVANDSSSAHYVLDQISAVYNVSGAVDEDHVQLRRLEDETNQTVILIDRLLKVLSEDLQRQTAYVANERANLTTLANAIKNGELYGGDSAAPVLGGIGSGSGGTSLAYSGTPLVVIRFDQPNVDYQQTLYAALNQALQSRPGAGFQVVAVSPTRGTASSVQLAQTAARRHAQDVMRSMTDMGVPATRLAVASATDPGAASSEVRIFVR
jgi:hypothetical protein